MVLNLEIIECLLFIGNLGLLRDAPAADGQVKWAANQEIAWKFVAIRFQ